jgi:hypothetical protein
VDCTELADATSDFLSKILHSGASVRYHNGQNDKGFIVIIYNTLDEQSPS